MEDDRTMTAPEDIDRYVMENWESLESDLLEDPVNTAEYQTPIQMSDSLIEKLETELEEMKEAADTAEKEKITVHKFRARIS